MVESHGPFRFVELSGAELVLTPPTSAIMEGLGKDRSEPALLPAIVEFLANYLDRPPRQLAQALTENTLKFFNIS